MTVVVPVYNVEHYLADCLDSILGQTFADLTVVVVVNGSTDGSGQIATEYARRDPRMRLVQRERADLGAARNAGARLATTEYLAFCDSDDVLPERAYERLVGTLDETHSDFAVGLARRQTGGRFVAPTWAKDLHRRDRLRVTLDDVPEAIADITAWNKVFRRSFFEASRLRFTEGAHYEDHVPISRAYLLSHSFDILAAHVYDWRTRVDGTSITQHKAAVSDLHERFAAQRRAAAQFAELGWPKVTDAWYSAWIDHMLPPYYRETATAGDD
ncbi:MAG: glycosyltransferase family 2 protein, partial [Sciscionella sp.]